MGRKTFESLPKPLDGRKLVVLTHGKLPQAPAAAGAVTTASTLELAFDIASRRSDDEVFIAGGAQVFKEALPLADRLYLTEIHHDVEGDATFPAWDGRAWRLVSSSTRREAGDRTGVTYTFSTYERTEQ
jgi:dihydrofolate reductase